MKKISRASAQRALVDRQDLRVRRRKAPRIQRKTNAQLKAIANRRRLQTEAHLGMSIEDWRLKKREQWAEVVHALERFSFGSAYTPAKDLWDLQKAADRIAQSMAVDWVCW